MSLTMVLTALLLLCTVGTYDMLAGQADQYSVRTCVDCTHLLRTRTGPLPEASVFESSQVLINEMVTVGSLYEHDHSLYLQQPSGDIGHQRPSHKNLHSFMWTMYKPWTWADPKPV
jgi:hypothetical protein